MGNRMTCFRSNRNNVIQTNNQDDRTVQKKTLLNKEKDMDKFTIGYDAYSESSESDGDNDLSYTSSGRSVSY